MCVYIAKEIHFSLWRETFHWREKKKKKRVKKLITLRSHFLPSGVAVFPHDGPSHQNSLSLIAF